MKALGPLLLLLVAACAHVPEAVAFQRLERQNKTLYDFGPLSAGDRSFVEACDRFLAEFPQSDHRQLVAFAAARVLDSHAEFEEALPRLMAIATAAQPDPKLCARAQELVLDMDNVRFDWPTYGRDAQVFAQTPCALAKGPNPNVPQFVGDGVNDPALDRLGFLEGCWQYFHIDWGFGACWHREGARWVGFANPFGPMERHATVIGLQITHGSSGLLFSAGTDAFWPLFDGLEAVPMTELSENQVRFGDNASIAFALQDDHLTFRRPGQREYSLRRSWPVIEPTFVGDGVNAPSLEALGFLDGCWQDVNVDRGLRICWARDRVRWVGVADPLGVKERDTPAIGLQIAHGPDGLVFSAGHHPRGRDTRPGSVFDGQQATALSELSSTEVRFGPIGFRVAKDTLTLLLDGQPVEYLRRAPARH